MTISMEDIKPKNTVHEGAANDEYKISMCKEIELERVTIRR